MNVIGIAKAKLLHIIKLKVVSTEFVKIIDKEFDFPFSAVDDDHHHHCDNDVSQLIGLFFHPPLPLVKWC